MGLYQKVKKSITFLVLGALLFSAVPHVTYGSDYENHWANSAITEWSKKGIVVGYADGSFKPQNNITRAELAVIITRIFGFSDDSGAKVYVDVKQEDWYGPSVAKVSALGIVNDYGKEFKPQAKATREEAVYAIARAYQISKQSQAATFKDEAQIAAWAKQEIEALAAGGYIKGRTGAMFYPKAYITRAEIVTLVDKITSELFNKSGIYSQNISGNVIINTKDVILKNMTIKGNLYLAQGIGEGDVTLNNVKVTGTVFANGGGQNSVYIINSQIYRLEVNKENGQIRIVADTGTNIEYIEVLSGAKLEGDFGTIEVTGDGQIIVSGNIKELVISVPGATISLAEGAVVETLKVETMARVSGEGKIKEAVISSQGVIIEQKPDKLTITNKDITAEVNGKIVKQTEEDKAPAAASSSGSSNESSGTQTVNVSAITVTGEGGAAFAALGKTLQMSAAVTPDNASNKMITWSVLPGTGTAMISTNGLLKTTGIGAVTVVATNTASGVTGRKEITITAPENNYTALGDSITYGMSAAPGAGYVNAFYNDLKSVIGNEEMTVINLGMPGDKSSDLLLKLQNDPTTIESVRRAKVITISIGGNNLLSPTISTLAGIFNLNPARADFATQLASALSNPENQLLVQAALPKLSESLLKGAEDFAADWPQIIGILKTYASNAEIYVTTLYNPINVKDPFYIIFNPAVEGINSIIKTPNTGYKVADVARAFREYSGEENLVDFSLVAGNLDPHPTNKGHELIYQCHLTATPITSVLVNKTTLITIIEASKDTYAAVSSDGSDIEPSEKWTTQEVKNTFENVVAAAQGVADNIEATQQEVNNAIGVLATAFQVYNAAKQEGNKQEVIVPGDAIISINVVAGVTIPVKGEIPVTMTSENDQFTGSITWEPVDNIFGADTVYTATIIITPKTGYTLMGVPKDFFNITGATATNGADSGTVTAIFPATDEEEPTDEEKVAAARQIIQDLNIGWHTNMAATIAGANIAIAGVGLPRGVTAAATEGTGENAGNVVIIIQSGAITDATLFLSDSAAPRLISVSIYSSNPKAGVAITGDTVSMIIQADEEIEISEMKRKIGETISDAVIAEKTNDDDGTTWKLFFVVSNQDPIEGRVDMEFVMTDKAGNTTKVDFASVTNGTMVEVDRKEPSITGGTLGADNAFVDIVFSRPVYGDSENQLSALEASDFNAIIKNVGGTLNPVSVAITSLSREDGLPLSGGEQVVRAYLSFNGTLVQGDKVEIRPALNAIFDDAGNAASITETTGFKNLTTKITYTWDEINNIVTIYDGPSVSRYSNIKLQLMGNRGNPNVFMTNPTSIGGDVKAKIYISPGWDNEADFSRVSNGLFAEAWGNNQIKFFADATDGGYIEPKFWREHVYVVIQDFNDSKIKTILDLNIDSRRADLLIMNHN